MVTLARVAVRAERLQVAYDVRPALGDWDDVVNLQEHARVARLTREVVPIPDFPPHHVSYRASVPAGLIGHLFLRVLACAGKCGFQERV